MNIVTKEHNLSSWELEKWIRNQIEFLKPLVLYSSVLYFPPLIQILSVPGHIVSFSDFAPSNAVILGVVLYSVNGLYDLLRKWASSNRYMIED